MFATEVFDVRGWGVNYSADGDVSVILYSWSEEEGTDDVLLSLGLNLLLHAPDSCLEEEVDEVFVGSFGADEAQGVDVLALALLGDDDDGVALEVEDVVGE